MTKVSVKQYHLNAINRPIYIYTLSNQNGIEIKLTNLGGTLLSVRTPDKNGQLDDIILGYEDVSQYMNNPHYFGSTIGRFSNRIANATFKLEGKSFQLEKNHPPHHLHGGNYGFDQKIWKSKILNDDINGVELTLLSYDNEGGYPGNLAVKITFGLTNDNQFIIQYYAEVDKLTPVSLTNHSYFNLGGINSNNIFDHYLQINSDDYLEIDQTGLPSGAILSNHNSPFDFRSPRQIGPIHPKIHPQLKIANGFDHNFVLNKSSNRMSRAATLFHPSSGRKVELSTTEPGLQLYSGNGLVDIKGKSNQQYQMHAGLCLEPQQFPNSPNQLNFPSPFIHPEEPYQHTTSYSFGLM